MTTRHVHQSGYPQTTAAQVKAALDYFTSAPINAEVITFTGVSKPQRAAMKAWATGHGWHAWAPDGWGYDGAVLSKNRIEVGKAWRLTKLLLRTARDNPIMLIAAKVEGHGWFATWHAPAHTGGLEPDRWPTKVYLSALVGLRLARSRMRRPTIAADWNLNLASKKWRDFLTRPYRYMRFGWQSGQEPTFGSTRVIDGIMTVRQFVKRSVTLRKLAGFDHKAVLTVLD